MKKHIVIIVLYMMVFSTCSAMKLQRTFSKDSKVNIDSLSFPLQSIDQKQLSELSGAIVLWKKNEQSFYRVILGEHLIDTSYKVYQAENAGIVCNASDLYWYKEQK